MLMSCFYINIIMILYCVDLKKVVLVFGFDVKFGNNFIFGY